MAGNLGAGGPPGMPASPVSLLKKARSNPPSHEVTRPGVTTDYDSRKRERAQPRRTARAEGFSGEVTVKVSSSGLRQPAGDSLNDLDPAGRYTRLWVSVGSEAMPAWANLGQPAWTGTLQSEPVPCETPQITA